MFLFKTKAFQHWWQVSFPFFRSLHSLQQNIISHFQLTWQERDTYLTATLALEGYF